jgi:hypothetical protein
LSMMTKSAARSTSMMPQSSALILAVLPVAKQNAIVGFLYQQFSR